MDTSEESYFSSADEDEDAQQAQLDQARRPPMLPQPLGLKLRLEAQQAQHVEAGAAALRSHALARRQAAGEEAGVDMGTGMAAGAAGAGARDGEAAPPHSPGVNGRVEMSVSPSLGPRPLVPLVDYGDDEEDELPMKGGLWRARCAHAVPMLCPCSCACCWLCGLPGRLCQQSLPAAAARCCKLTLARRRVPLDCLMSARVFLCPLPCSHQTVSSTRQRAGRKTHEVTVCGWRHAGRQ